MPTASVGMAAISIEYLEILIGPGNTPGPINSRLGAMLTLA
jgi:hypothetical protein